MSSDQKSSDIQSWLRLVLTPGIGGATQRKLLKHFGSADTIFSVDYHALSEVIGQKSAQSISNFDYTTAVDHAIAWSDQKTRHILTLADPDYPKRLLDTPDPPSVIYVHGNLEVLNALGRPLLGVVGSRHATPQGLETAKAFSRELAKQGSVIISGLALGIDAEAHRGTLEAGGLTIAVLGTGIDHIYPVRNKKLAAQILDRGLLISEFPLGTPAIAANFPRRNRLISGLSHGVLVVEATMESGSLITARMATEQGREVFAIPGSIHSPCSRGCHHLIKQGAKLVETTKDILEELNPAVNYSGSTSKPTLPDKQSPAQSIDKPLIQLSDEEHAVLDIISPNPCSLDDLVIHTGKAVDVLLPILLSLELAGTVSPLPGNQYQRLY